ncbi:hypothetical protein AG1IA_08339 [Rhizoctonia solani AG-1 IA]|uniref:Uncharacterized protein n=1 Tax=Thanatephorus cucumeris (strain AG1-IA) TaxID=983506 RepID=L8WLJ1_THACA|nr:hypothetical protein AG1IA_08339 [Rhizoctonia solani AG-1 IA]
MSLRWSGEVVERNRHFINPSKALKWHTTTPVACHLQIGPHVFDSTSEPPRHTPQNILQTILYLVLSQVFHSVNLMRDIALLLHHLVIQYSFDKSLPNPCSCDTTTSVRELIDTRRPAIVSTVVSGDCILYGGIQTKTPLDYCIALVGQSTHAMLQPWALYTI